MIKNWLVRGDTHGNFLWMNNGCLDNYTPKETAIIILGDAGFDFYLNKIDERKKKEVDSRGYYIYWLRGNHEARASDIQGYDFIFDNEVNGYVWCDKRFPHLRQFEDYGFYDIGGYTCLIISGAYSVDKNWRLKRFNMTEENNNPKISGWFNNEQLSVEEMKECTNFVQFFNANNRKADFVFSHTCPFSWQPTDLFLGGINQSTIDNTMELWMNQLKNMFKWKVWCFAHYHADRIERPYVEQYFNDIESLDNIMNRWVKYDEVGKLDWWINKGPNFFMN